MQVLILAGGLGTRLQSVLPEIPKPLAPIGQKPFLYYLLEQIKGHGINEVIISVGYRAGQIEEAFGDGSGLGIRIRYVREDNPLGTGGALRNALPFLMEREILVINGDTYFDINHQTLLKYHRLWNAGVTMALKYQTEVARYGLVNLALQTCPLTGQDSLISGQYQVVSFFEKTETNQCGGFINGGLYLIRRKLIELIPPVPASLERDILPFWTKQGFVYGLPFGGKFIDIGIPDDYRLAVEKLDSWVKLPKYRALFLDRDGVVNEDFGYVWRKEDIRFIPRTIELIRQANRWGWKVVVVTNQAGVARGYYTEENVQTLHQWMDEKLRESGARVDVFFYCPHHQDGIINPYKRKCLCRKPMPGMLLGAAEFLNIDIEHSRMIGDKIVDRIRLPYLKSIVLKIT